MRIKIINAYSCHILEDLSSLQELKLAENRNVTGMCKSISVIYTSVVYQLNHPPPRCLFFLLSTGSVVRPRATAWHSKYIPQDELLHISVYVKCLIRILLIWSKKFLILFAITCEWIMNACGLVQFLCVH